MVPGKTILVQDLSAWQVQIMQESKKGDIYQSSFDLEEEKLEEGGKTTVPVKQEIYQLTVKSPILSESELENYSRSHTNQALMHQGNQYVAQANKKTENQGKDKSAHTCSAEAKTKEGEQVADHIEGIDKYA